MASRYPAGVRDGDFGYPDDDFCHQCESHVDDCDCEQGCGHCNSCRRGRPCDLLDPDCP